MGRLRIGIVDDVVTSPVLGLQKALGRYCEYARDVFIDLMLGTPAELETAGWLMARGMWSWVPCRRRCRG